MHVNYIFYRVCPLICRFASVPRIRSSDAICHTLYQLETHPVFIYMNRFRIYTCTYLTLQVRECPKDKESWSQMLEIYPVGLAEKLEIQLEMMCECDCEKDGMGVSFTFIYFFLYKLGRTSWNRTRINRINVLTKHKFKVSALFF